MIEEEKPELKNYLIQVTYELTTYIPVLSTAYSRAAELGEMASTRTLDKMLPNNLRPVDLRVGTRIDLVYGPEGVKEIESVFGSSKDYMTKDGTP